LQLQKEGRRECRRENGSVLEDDIGFRLGVGVLDLLLGVPELREMRSDPLQFFANRGWDVRLVFRNLVRALFVRSEQGALFFKQVARFLEGVDQVRANFRDLRFQIAFNSEEFVLFHK
jgi:hypothetical protein